MKKFFFTLFILLLIGGAAFFFGWAQLTVPPGSYGVIISKTHGVDPLPVRSGEFRWIWYKLIPTNVQIAVFNLETEKYQINFNSSLPSGDSYAAFAGLTSANSPESSLNSGSSIFSWNLRAVIAFSINPDSIVSLVQMHNISNQEALDALLKDTAKGIELIILQTLSSEKTDIERLENLLAGFQDTEMEKEILKKYSGIHDFSLSVQSARFPDFILYRQVRLLYEEFLAKQREVIAGSFGRKAENHIQMQLHFDELERYGILLSKYPVLLEYLALEKNGKTEQ